MVFFEGDYQEYESDHRKRLEAAGEDPDQRAGLKGTDGARTGIVTLIQRFGSALNLKKQSYYPRCASH